MDYGEILKRKAGALWSRGEKPYEYRPYGTWAFVLSSFAFCLILIVWFGVSLFFGVSNGAFFADGGAPARAFKETLDQKRLGETTGRYKARALMLEKRKQSPFWVEDPSW
ncbi:hypothetical protein A3A38_01910 [Candidatus Kaiserbacteria bacterium RIFCSPLOWO2_01_FULL_53_17]|uniref:Uncharacterized protein n=1 Tax=Candidatus Kaiserbacteria bacterium RIFCSPLOWO2_01_FULL_53_17 TaxID=1798511 RepID=A0A1F6EHC1_9BACT|nr:MAG: hypothetical protein A3A38_01910 [Candidatus Kaiserbacteria bacterium RIFCSPLOWO2_01_FULL_53_17]